MKTVFVPGSLNANVDLFREIIIAQPVIAYACLVFSMAIVARFMVKYI